MVSSCTESIGTPKRWNSGLLLTRLGAPSGSRRVQMPKASEIAIEAPIAVIRKASGGALRLRSGRYATRSITVAVPAEAMAATIIATSR